MMKNAFSLFQNDSLAERYTVFYLLNISDLYVSSDGLIYSKFFFHLAFYLILRHHLCKLFSLALNSLYK